MLAAAAADPMKLQEQPQLVCLRRNVFLTGFVEHMTFTAMTLSALQYVSWLIVSSKAFAANNTDGLSPVAK